MLCGRDVSWHIIRYYILVWICIYQREVLSTVWRSMITVGTALYALMYHILLHIEALHVLPYHHTCKCSCMIVATASTDIVKHKCATYISISIHIHIYKCHGHGVPHHPHHFQPKTCHQKVRQEEASVETPRMAEETWAHAGEYADLAYMTEVLSMMC